MVNAVASPMRLFTPFDMVVGKYGTAVWIDAQTDLDSPAQAGDHGQRIAGKVLSVPKKLYNPPSSTTSSSSTAASQSSTAASTSEDAGTLAEVDDSVSAGYVQAAAAATLGVDLEEDGPVMAFDVRESEDTWNKLAICEEEGRIAVSDVDGTVTLLYFNPEDR